MKDLIIIGGGPGGYVAAIRARQLGLSVVLIEKDSYGGTCLNRGCIPTKAYYQNAVVLRTIMSSSEFNVQVNDVAFDMAGACRRKNEVVQRLVSGVAKLLKDNGATLIKGTAILVDKNTVLVDGLEIRANHLLIATGSSPWIPPIPGCHLEGVINSDQLLDLDRVPERLAIVGGGVVGLEFACIFSCFGSRVTVFESMPELLPGMDRELGKRLRVFLKKQKIIVHTATAVDNIAEGDGTRISLEVNASSKGSLVKTQADKVLMAAGRQPYTDGLQLDRLGIATDLRGFIQVDHHFQTNVQGVYAIGDVIGGVMLAHVASEEGLCAVENIAGHASAVHYHAVPACVFTVPEIATVGLSEEAAHERGLQIRSGKFQFAANGKAMTMGATEGMVKVLADQNDTIVGMHIIGPHASDLIMEGTLLVKNRMKVSELIGTIHPHPTLSEAIMEAVLDLQGQALHLSPPRR